jgi:uncharacterized protein
MMNFSLLIKPASGDCNLRCRYCFYLQKSDLFGPGAHRMNADVLETFTRKFLSMPMPQHSFGWQGGEPTLMGVDFFRQAVAYQRRYARAGARVSNSLQSNGTLLDAEWGRFLQQEQFLVGISIDGPASLHDISRLHRDGRGSHAEVLRGLGVLREQRVEHNVLTLVSHANENHADTVYHYLGELGVTYQQYIECVEFAPDGQRQPYALSPGKWGEFLCRIFDLWYPRDTRRISIRLFDSILSRLLTGVPTICAMSGDCRNYFVIEHNGEVYPCDFQVRPELLLGNILNTDFAALQKLESYRSWGQLKNPRSARCDACRFLPLCMGDCPKNRHAGQSYLCEDWQLFYQHCIGRFEELAASLSAERQQATMQHAGGASPGGKVSPPGRNDPCPCGSGKKYKKCCGK